MLCTAAPTQPKILHQEMLTSRADWALVETRHVNRPSSRPPAHQLKSVVGWRSDGRERRCVQTMFEKTLGAVPPHIVWIIADDLGTFDVPFTNSGSEVLTPTLSRLAAGGLVLDQYCVCPSRIARG